MITEGTIDADVYTCCLDKIKVFNGSIGDCSEILGNIANEINKIMFNPLLSEEERKIKLEQMKDNEVRKIQEIRHLEDEEKSLFGFDLSEYITKKDVNNAKNTWLSAENICSLVKNFLNELLGKGEYIRGKDAIKTIRLSRKKKDIMLNDFKRCKQNNATNIVRKWENVLKSAEQNIRVTFDFDVAKENREILFITKTHPLVKQASSYYKSCEFPYKISLSVVNNDIPQGSYAFLIYSHVYTSVHSDCRLIAVSDNEKIQNEILELMQYAEDFDSNDDFSEKWNLLEKLHYNRWKNDLTDYKNDVFETCQYQKEQLAEFLRRRETVINLEIQRLNAEKIIRMKQGEIGKAKANYQQKILKLDELKEKADIHSTLLVKGVVRIKSLEK